MSASPIVGQKSAYAEVILKEGGFTRWAGKTGRRRGKVGHLTRISSATDGFYAEKMPYDEVKTHLRQSENIFQTALGV
ncbi:hypothetical protein [Neisseria iguanae]|uniref:Uncharacterized protein n=1 Tax=Neisseria iguanae TaxID=90242 RepID=A0A2P7U1C2_9NEIS|nr:hypothetical protein [Neisseria iguanae]PSJ80776.1 hypothetical protein C7N83_04300 [Neisseria iguanae]